jgi:heptose I phosphotransferase
VPDRIVAEAYLREDFATLGEPLRRESGVLLDFAEQVAVAAATDDVYRNREGRVTLRFQRAGRSFFLKLHRGIGWGEIFKNLLQARLPVLGAGNEYRAVQALRALGVDTLDVAAYAESGLNPATRHSMIVTDDLVGTVSLEDYCANWRDTPPSFLIRLKVLLKVADSAGRMHRAGINHRDFYICHFHLDEASLAQPLPRCYLIDLHRAQMRRRTPRRWQVKDLAGLYFSAMDCGLRRRDLLRFLSRYTPGGLREALGPDAGLWREVQDKAQRLYRREHGREPPAPPMARP